MEFIKSAIGITASVVFCVALAIIGMVAIAWIGYFVMKLSPATVIYGY